MEAKETAEWREKRKSLHHKTEEMPQWRERPEGPHTMCNAVETRGTALHTLQCIGNFSSPTHYEGVTAVKKEAEVLTLYNHGDTAAEGRHNLQCLCGTGLTAPKEEGKVPAFLDQEEASMEGIDRAAHTLCIAVEGSTQGSPDAVEDTAQRKEKKHRHRNTENTPQCKVGLEGSHKLSSAVKRKARGAPRQSRKFQKNRKCQHCETEKTPQWREGPEGPHTLCNACGVRYKSGRLLPEYRPVSSPSFSSDLHSNTHQKVLERRKRKGAGAVDGVEPAEIGGNVLVGAT